MVTDEPRSRYLHSSNPSIVNNTSLNPWFDTKLTNLKALSRHRSEHYTSYDGRTVFLRLGGQSIKYKFSCALTLGSIHKYCMSS